MIKKFCFKKYFLFSLLFFVSTVSAQKKFTIVLDAGHGGSDHGAYRSYDDIGTIREKDITLAVVLRIGKMLEKDKDFKVIYTRKVDEYPSLTERTTLANRSKADLFVSVHVNANTRTAPYGTETFVQNPDQNRTNLEVAKAENDVIYLDAQDRATFASYDPTSPESLIAMKLQQSKYLEGSLVLGGFVEENFAKKDNRLSRGVKQQNLHVLRMNAMPSVLIETGFVSNYEEALYLASEKGKDEIAESIYNGIISYKKAYDRKGGRVAAAPKAAEKPSERPLKNDFRILLMSSPLKHSAGDPALKGLNYVTPIKEGNLYKYYYGVSNYASIRDINLKTARDAGFKNAFAVGFVPNQKLKSGYYTIELAATKDKLSSNNPMLQKLKDVQRNKEGGIFYYTYGQFSSLEDAVKAQKDIEQKGITNTVLQKVSK